MFIFSSNSGRRSFVTFSPNGKYILVSTLDGKIALWNFLKEKKAKSYVGHRNEKYSILGDFYGGKYIISGSEDNKVYIWDLQSKEIFQTLEGHSGELFLYSCAY